MTASRARADVLIFVEDPGAANFVAGLPRALADSGHRARLAASGAATALLQQRGLSVDALPPHCDADALLAEVAPRLVVVGTAENPDSLGLRLTASARSLRIPSIGALDSSTHLAHRFRGRGADALAFCPDVVIVPDTDSRDGLADLGLDADRIVVAGHPHWDHVRSTHHSLQQDDRSELRRRLFPRAAPGRAVVLFAAEISDGMEPGQFQRSGEYTLAGNGGSHGRTEIVIEEFLAAAAPLRDRLYLVLRLHPKQSPADLPDHRGAFDAVSRTETSLEAIHASDAVVGMTSMIMIEAALMEKPTLAILPRAREAAWLPTIAAGVTPCALDRDAVRREVARLPGLPPPGAPAALGRLFPAGALQRMAGTCERVGLLSSDGPGSKPAA